MRIATTCLWIGLSCVAAGCSFGELDVPEDGAVIKPDAGVASTDMASGKTWPGKGMGTPNPDSVELFDTSTFPEFDLELQAKDWQGILDLHAKMPPPAETDPKVYFPCQLKYKAETFANAGCRLKGNPAYWHDEVRLQLVVKFDEYDNNGRFHGMRRLSFAYKPYRNAPIRDTVGEFIMGGAGLRNCRVNHVKVSVNGKYYGLYENIEDIDKEWLQYQYADASGNLYDHGFQLETNKTVNDTSDVNDMNDLVDAEPLMGDHSKFFAAIAKMIDVKEFLRFTAAERIMPTGDNWSNGSWNYKYYHVPNVGFHLLPNDLDTIIWGKDAPPDADIYAYWGSPDVGLEPNKMLQLLLQNAAWKKEFEDDLVEIRDGVYQKVPDKITAVCARIRDEYMKQPTMVAPVASFDADCESMKKAVADRIAYVKRTLGR